MGGIITDFSSVTSDEINEGISHGTRQLQCPSKYRV